MTTAVKQCHREEEIGTHRAENGLLAPCIPSLITNTKLEMTLRLDLIVLCPFLCLLLNSLSTL